jgi:hypothetical protein
VYIDLMKTRQRRRTKRVSITLDEETLAKARARAAERDMSVSRYLAEMLDRDKRHDDEYEAAYQAWLRRKPWHFSGPRPYPKRAELYRGFEAEPDEDAAKKPK